MSAEQGTVDAPKYARGKNPRSLANLRPPWQPGEITNHNGARGPYIRPHLQRFAEMPLDELQVLISSKKLKTAEAIAAAWLMDSLTAGAFSTGRYSRGQVADRLDGPVGKGDSVAVGVNVNLTFQDNSQA